MNRKFPLILVTTCGLLLVGTDVSGGQAGPPTQWSSVEAALGRKGITQPGGVLRFSFPRRDLSATVDGIQIRPALALGSWAAFKRVGGGHTMVMGDLVLLESEVNVVISELQKGGVEQTALHNHVLLESPRTMYMHIAAHGDEARIAAAIRAALERTATPLGPPPAGPPYALGLDTAAIAGALGHSGTANGGVYQVSVARAETIRDGRNEVPASMGLATVINFQATGPRRAAITGDFVMTASEVNRVIRALRDNGIGITALHSHMLTESPRLFFMHFWANDEVTKLARGLRAGLDQTNSRRTNR